MSKPNNTTKWLPVPRKVAIPQKTLEAYTTYKAYGDLTNILHALKDKTISTVKIGRALKSGLGEPDIVDAIVKYYDDVVDLHKAYKN